jgi:hypothetical protein
VSAGGFKADFVRQAVLPDWWNDACAQDRELLPDVEIRVARFVGVPASIVRDPSVPLRAPAFAQAQLRRVRNTSKYRLGPAIHAAMQISAATIRAWGEKAPKVRLPPKDPVAWRANLTGVRLPDVLRDLWDRGIPVIHVETLPSPSFQGLAWIARDRPVIVLGHALDEPARLAFIIAHEVAHIVNGDCSVDVPVVDEEEEVYDDHEMEKRADAYAIGLLTGGCSHSGSGCVGLQGLGDEGCEDREGPPRRCCGRQWHADDTRSASRSTIRWKASTTARLCAGNVAGPSKNGVARARSGSISGSTRHVILATSAIHSPLGRHATIASIRSRRRELFARQREEPARHCRGLVSADCRTPAATGNAF